MNWFVTPSICICKVGGKGGGGGGWVGGYMNDLKSESRIKDWKTLQSDLHVKFIP